MQFEGNEGSEEDAAQAAVESLRNAVDAANESDAAADNAAQKVTDALDLNISSESVVAEDAAVNDQELDAPSQAHKNVGRYKSGAGQNYDPYDANAPSKYSDYESQPYTLGDIFRNDAKIARLQACEEQFCQTMWSCAGGRCLSRSDRIKRDWRRSFEMRSGNCGCSNIPFPFLSGLIIEPMLGYGFFGGCDGSIDCRQTVKDYAGCPAGSANRPNNCSCQQHFQY